jgi:hypothetical protein
MRTGLCIIAGAALIAISILIVGRYSIGIAALGSERFTVVGVDTWTGRPFALTGNTK